MISYSFTTPKVGDLGYSTTVKSFAVYNGSLYAGTFLYDGLSGHGKVYRYDDGTTWTEVGDLGGWVQSLAVYNGKLYAGTGTPLAVYRYDGGTTWTDVGQFIRSDGYDAYSLAVYNGKLYVGTEDPGIVYRYDGGTTWTNVGDLGGVVHPLAVYNRKLYAGSYDPQMVYRYDGGTTWTSIGCPKSDTWDFWPPDWHPVLLNDTIESLAVYNGKLYGSGSTVYSICG